MDAVSSATLVLSSTAASTRKATPGEPRSGLVTVAGVALCVPYSVQVAAMDSAHRTTEQHVTSILASSFAEAESIFSPYCSSSELVQKINSPQATVGEWFRISRCLYDVLLVAQQLHELSEGLFDPTVVHFGKEYCKAAASVEGHVLPRDHALVQRAEALVGWGRVFKIRATRLDGSMDTVYEAWKGHPDVAVDPSACSKGYVVDMLAEKLIANNYFDIFVDWGGDVRCAGQHPDGRPWTCAVRDIEPAAGPARVPTAASSAYAMHDGDAMCTSGDYFQLDMLTKYHHMYDPTSRIPLAQGLVGSVTLQVHGGSCAWCDGLTTAAFLVHSLRCMKDSDEPLLQLIQRANALRPLTACTRAVVIKRSGEHRECHEVFQQPRPAATSCQLAANSGACLRLLVQTLPRLVTVLLVPTLDTSGHVEFVAATLSSFVFYAPSRGVLFLQHFSAIADAARRLEAHHFSAPGGVEVPSMQLLVLGSINHDAQRVAEDFATGKMLPDGWRDGSGAAMFFKKVSLSCKLWSFGDHMAADVECPECDLSEEPPAFLLRAHRKYLSGAPPRGSLRQGKALPPRCCCVATVTVVSRDVADPVVLSFLGTVLYGVDLSSRAPLSISALAKAGPVSAKNFGDHLVGDGSASTSGTVTVVRLHFLRDCSDTKSLIDWFADPRCDDVQMQFMYIGKPSLKTLRSVNCGLDTAGPKHVDYLFPAGIQLGFVDCLCTGGRGLASGASILLSLAPLHAETSSVLDVSSALGAVETRT